MKEIFTLGDISYHVTSADVVFDDSSGSIVMYPEICAETDAPDVEYEMSSLRLYHNNGFDTGASQVRALAGKRFVWDGEYNSKGEEAGTLCVQEHEPVTSGTIEILEVKKNSVKLRWSGTANVGWGEKYGDNVPFDSTFTVRLSPAYKTYIIDMLRREPADIGNDTRFETLNTEEFNSNLIKTFKSGADSRFSAELKFRLTREGSEYLGSIVFDNAAFKEKTPLEHICSGDGCSICTRPEFPLTLRLNCLDFSLPKWREEFTFEMLMLDIATQPKKRN